MTIYTNSGLVLAMESAIAAAKTITAITAADPGVVTSVAHGYVDGDIVLLEVEGMVELNNRLFIVANKADDTFELKDQNTGEVGIDTSTFDAFSSGTAKKVTLGTTISGVQEFSASGGDPKFVDTTTVQDKTDKQIIVGANAINYSMTMQWDPGNAGQQAMIDAFVAGEQKGFRITWPNGRYVMFYGSVGYSGMPGGANQGVTTSPAAVSVAGNPTFGISG
jgi:hypothetical protein